MGTLEVDPKGQGMLHHCAKLETTTVKFKAGIIYWFYISVVTTLSHSMCHRQME